MFVQHVQPDAVQAKVSQYTDQQIVDAVRFLDKARNTPEHAQTRIWLVNEFENRHPEIDEQVEAFFDQDDNVLRDLEYIDILAQYVPGVK